MKLKTIVSLGRFKYLLGANLVNVKKGKDKNGFDVYFYLYRGSRVLIPEAEFRHNWIKDN